MKAISVLIALVLFLFAPLVFKPALAVTVTITNFPATITDEPFTITASISGASSGTNYLRVDLYKEGTQNYFGETFNGSDWYGDSTYSQYLPIVVQSGITWNGTVDGRIGSPTGTEYDGNGTYKLRLRRYTGGGGNTASEANNSAVTISINLPAPTGPPTNTPTSTNTPTPTNIPTPTKTPTPKPSLTPTLNPSSKLTPTTTSGVLGENTQSLSKNSEKADKEAPKIEASSLQNKPLFPLIFIFIGVIFLILCVIVIFYPFLKKLKEEKFNG